jgi:hypothetical protein
MLVDFGGTVGWVGRSHAISVLFDSLCDGPSLQEMEYVCCWLLLESGVISLSNTVAETCYLILSCWR